MMMQNNKLFTMMALKVAMAATFVLSAGTAVGADDDKKLTKAEKRMAKVMEKYEFTGKTKSCVSLTHLRHQRIIDDQTIFFDAPGKKAYMNKMDRKCPRLSQEERFAFRTSINQLCSLDLITVIDSWGRDWSSCGLGKFHEMVKKPKEDKVD